MNFQFNETDEFIEINAGPVAEMKRDLCKGSIHFSGNKAPFPYFVTVRDTKSIAVMVRSFHTYQDAASFVEDNAREIDFDCGFQSTLATFRCDKCKGESNRPLIPVDHADFTVGHWDYDQQKQIIPPGTKITRYVCAECCRG